MDVRTVITAHAQYLRAFCHLSKQVLSYEAASFLNSALISSKVLPSNLLKVQVDTELDSLRSTGGWQLLNALGFIRVVTSNIQWISGLGTNAFAYIPASSGSTTSLTAAVAVNAYRANETSNVCYCLSSNNCPVPGAIYSSPQVPTFGVFNLANLANTSTLVKGIQMGCYALESLLSSTLECYFDSACLQLISSSPIARTPLNATRKSRFTQNMTIETLLNSLLVEEWFTSLSAESYYTECAPRSCTYTVDVRNGILAIVTTIVALVGGLNVALRLLVPLMIQIVTKWMQRRSPDRVVPIDPVIPPHRKSASGRTSLLRRNRGL